MKTDLQRKDSRITEGWTLIDALKRDECGEDEYERQEEGEDEDCVEERPVGNVTSCDLDLHQV